MKLLVRWTSPLGTRGEREFESLGDAAQYAVDRGDAGDSVQIWKEFPCGYKHVEKGVGDRA